MRDYITACGLPLLKIGDVFVPRLILGHLPFIGESYQGSEKNREYATRFSDTKNIVKIIRIATENYGITVTAAGIVSNNELANRMFRAIRETEKLTNIEIAIIPCVQIPLNIYGRPLDTYRRWLTYYEIESQRIRKDPLNKYLEDPVLQCRSGWRAKFKETLQHSKPYRREELEYLQVDYEYLDRKLTIIEGFNTLFAELGSETDFLTMTNRLDLLEKLVNYIKIRYGHRILLGVHHAGITIPKLEASRLKFDGFVTPINKLGVMMFPTRSTATEAIRAAKRPIIAIKPLAGGRIGPKEALRYIFRELGIGFSMIGIGSQSEAKKDFSVATEILKR